MMLIVQIYAGTRTVWDVTDTTHRFRFLMAVAVEGGRGISVTVVDAVCDDGAKGEGVQENSIYLRNNGKLS